MEHCGDSSHQGIAAGLTPPPTANVEMIQATIPCLIGVKKIVLIAKEGALKWNKSNSEEMGKRELWRKECLQNERVKNMFNAWEASSKITVVSNTNVSEKDLKILEDNYEGLVFTDETANLPIQKMVVKGGEISKLVQWMSNHKFVGINRLI